MSIPYLTNYSEHAGKRVFVYWNLHKKCWSVRHKGKVLFHAGDLRLEDCGLSVSETGRQRVLREGKKYVHAGVKGTLSPAVPNHQAGTLIGYNPRKGGTFFEYDTGMPVFEAATIVMENDRKVRVV